jgi:uncharacterized protein
MATPRWLADEMVGRLARYLRFTGCDTAYARGVSDDRIVAWAATEDRVVLTRDRALARGAPRALLLESPSVRDQWRAVARAFPGLPRDVAFLRCTLCNGELAAESPPPSAASVPNRSSEVPGPSRPRFRCRACGHVYWEGSHTAQVRERLREWSRGLDP